MPFPTATVADASPVKPDSSLELDAEAVAGGGVVAEEAPPSPGAVADTPLEESEGSADTQAIVGGAAADAEMPPPPVAAEAATAVSETPETEAVAGAKDVEVMDEPAKCDDQQEVSSGTADKGAQGPAKAAPGQEAEEGEEADVVVVGEAAPAAGPRRLSQRKALQARAAEELKQGGYEEAIGRLRARLPAEDDIIKQKEGLEAVAVAEAEKANAELQGVAEEVATAAKAELEAARVLKAAEKRLAEVAARTSTLKDELERRRDVAVLLEMRFAKRKADEQEVALKRRKIEELEQVLAESKRAAEEIKKREQEAKEAMKQLVKEEKQLQVSRLGRFTQRYRQKMLTCAGEGAAEAVDPASAETGAASSSASQGSAPVRVKREIMQAFAPPKDSLPTMVVVIDDDSQ